MVDMIIFIIMIIYDYIYKFNETQSIKNIMVKWSITELKKKIFFILQQHFHNKEICKMSFVGEKLNNS